MANKNPNATGSTIAPCIVILPQSFLCEGRYHIRRSTRMAIELLRRTIATPTLKRARCSKRGFVT